MDVDLTHDLFHRVLVERSGFAFFIDIRMRIYPYRNNCKCIGHDIGTCKRTKIGQPLPEGGNRKINNVDTKGKFVLTNDKRKLQGDIPSQAIKQSEIVNDIE